MQELRQNDTICAIATPPGHGGIGVVRISGPEARRVLSFVWRGGPAASEFEPKRIYLGQVALGGSDIDRAMAVFMPAPYTYTGDDTVEISAHGSPILLQKLLAACCEAGARIAAPGEFTRRAFLAGKMDLAQAEGVADLIAATSDRAARAAADQLGGALSKRIGEISDSLGQIRAEIEAAIDFPEEEIETADTAKLCAGLARAETGLSALSQSFAQGRQVREGVRVAIVGRPNVGKSSIFNLLVGRQRAIVHHSPGTTRDVVEDAIEQDGITFLLCDTAGIRSSDCAIETMGIEKTRAAAASADLVLAVFDGSEEQVSDDDALISEIDAGKTILVINKSDLPRRLDADRLMKLGAAGVIFTSAEAGRGREDLLDSFKNFTDSSGALADGVIVTSARHKALIDEALLKVREALASISGGRPPELAASELAAAQGIVGKIIGKSVEEELLDRIFSRFCIGK